MPPDWSELMSVGKVMQHLHNTGFVSCAGDSGTADLIVPIYISVIAHSLFALHSLDHLMSNVTGLHCYGVPASTNATKDQESWSSDTMMDSGKNLQVCNSHLPVSAIEAFAIESVLTSDKMAFIVILDGLHARPATMPSMSNVMTVQVHPEDWISIEAPQSSNLLREETPLANNFKIRRMEQWTTGKVHRPFVDSGLGNRAV